MVIMKKEIIEEFSNKNYHNRFCNNILSCLMKKYPPKNNLQNITADINRVLFGKRIKKKVNKRIFTREDIIYQKIFLGCNEIDSTYLLLTTIPEFIKNISLQKTKIPQYTLIAYHYSNYLNEVYMLRERLDNYNTTIFRIYNRRKDNSELIHVQETLNGVLKAFDGIINVRGTHVHQNRIKLQEIQDLSLMESIAKTLNNDQAIIEYYKNKIKEVKRKYIRYITGRNKEIKIILDIYFGLLYYIVLNKDGNIIIP
jgi:hypothetical protein